MANQPQIPPPNQMIAALQTPNHRDTLFRELVSRDSARWRENDPIKRGTLYSSLKGGDPTIAQAFPGLYFLKETVPLGSTTVAGMWQREFVIWNWMTVPEAESAFNAEITQLADAITNPVFARTYTVLRSVYEASPYVATATPLTFLLGVKILNGGTRYTSARLHFDGPGSDSSVNVEAVINEGVITDWIVVDEGEGFTSASTATVVGDGDENAIVALIIQPVAAILTSQKKLEFDPDDPRSSEFVRVLKVYETLPGPWVPFTRYDDDLGPVQGRRRAVLNTGQLGGVITPTSKTNYDSRDGSSVVSIEIQENWSNGTGNGPNNPPYPVFHEDLYLPPRGSVQRESQIVVATGNEVGSFDRIATVGGRFIATKTDYIPYADNPFLLKRVIETWIEVVTSDRRLVYEYGGGETSIVENISEPGTHGSIEPTADEGYRTIEKQLQTTSPHEQLFRQEQLIAGMWPVQYGFHTDEITGIVVNFYKQVVPAGTPYPGQSGYRGPFVEMQPLDKWKSIQIVSSIDCSSLAAKSETWQDTLQISLPDTLLTIEAVWSDTIQKSAEANRDDVTVKVASGAEGGLIVTSRNGFRGYAKCMVARDYSCGPFASASVPQPFVIRPSSGSIVMVETNSETEAAANRLNTGTTSNSSNDSASFNGGRVGDRFQKKIHAIDIRDHIVGIITPTNATHNTPAVSAYAQSGGGKVRSILAFGTQCKIVVQVPPSIPFAIVTGQVLLWRVELTEWRFGVWVMTRYYVTVP